jgi:hypothetical protein
LKGKREWANKAGKENWPQRTLKGVLNAEWVLLLDGARIEEMMGKMEKAK